jgi:uncharacterized membrane protein
VSERGLRVASALVATAGAAVAAYLLAVRSGGAELVCRTGGCETVQSSEYAEVLGIPVAALGLAGFVAVGVLSLLPSPFAHAAAVSLALAALVFSAYLLVVQLAVIGEVCDWCLVNDVLVTALAALVVVRAATATSRSARSRGRSGRAPRGRSGAASA